ncbi:hypothetical protein BC832DRAFT_596046 [Gaertneriomyces semiglobifer]|nr:hypothetical protein BC832DRAFT_596046 [Gaertneriomyces semiglobifer]
MPVVRGVIGIGVIAAQDPITGIVTITNTSAPLMAEKPTAPVNPTDKGGGGGTLKDTYKNEEGGGGGGGGGGGRGGGGGGLNGGGSVGESSSGLAEPTETPILPPINPVDLQNTGRIGGPDGNDLLPCLNGLPPIFKGRDDKGENTWFVDSWGRRWSEELQLEVIEDGIERSVIQLDEPGVPITNPGHIDIILRGSDDDRISTAILTHDRHLQSGYINQGGILFEHPTTVPNIAMVYQAYEKYILPYVESCNYINVGQGLVKDGNTLSLNDDLSTFAKTSSIKALGFKDTLAYSELTGRPTLGTLAAKNSIAWTEVTSRPTLGTLSSKNTIDWTGTDILNKPTDLTTKTYVDSLSYLTVGAGLMKTGNTISLGSDLGAFEVKTNLKALAYKDSLSWTEITSKPTLGTLASKSSVSWITEVSGKPDLTVYETKTALKGLAYKDKVDYTTDVINAPASVIYGTGLLFSNNTLSLNPAVSVDSLATVGGISFGGNMSGTGNVSIGGTFTATKNANIAFNHILNNQSAASSSCTSLHLKAGASQGLYLHINSAGRGVYGGTSAGTVQNYAGSLRLLTRTETGGIVIDDVGDVDISQRLSVGMGTDIVAFPPVNLWANTGVVSARPYGNGTYVVSSSSKFNNSTQYDAWHAFTDNSALYPWYPLTGTYNVDSPFNYVGSISTTVDGVEVLGEWIQLQLPLPILLQSFDIAVLNVTTNFYIKEFVLVGSNDDTTFTQLMTSTFSWGAAGAQTLNVPVPNVSKGFKTYRLIIKSLLGNRTYCQVSRLIFYGKPVSMEIRGAISAKQILTDDLVCSGDVQMDGLGLQDDIPTTSVYPDIPTTAATTGQYTATSSSVYSGTWTGWKVYNPYAPDNNNTWFSAASVYSSTAPYSYIGSVSTTVDGTAVLGEYLQLDMQTAIALTSFYIAEPISGDSYNVKEFIIAGSSDGSSWKQVVSGTLDWSTAPSNGSMRELNVPVTTRVSHKSYRFITRSIQGESSGNYVQIYSLKYTGGSLKKVLNVEALKVTKIFGDLSIDNSVEFKDDIVDSIRYPKIQLTGATTQGYTANVSSNLNGTSAGWKAFSNSLEINDSYWSASTYSGGEQNLYQGIVQTSVDGTNIKGEYVELEMPEAIAITAFSFEARTPEMPSFPKDYIICGSDDRNTWTEINSGKMTYTIYQNSTSVNRYVSIKNYTTKKFKVFRFIVRNVISSTYAHIGKLTFYGSNTVQKIIDAPSAKVNGLSLTAPAYGMFQLHSSQSFSVNGTAYQLITKWTPSFGMESETIYCSTNSQDIVIKLPGIYKIELDLDVFQSGSGSVNSYFGFMSPGATVYYEDGYHVRKHSMVAGQKVTGSSICRVVEADTKMILRFISASSSGGITGSQASRLIIYRIAPLA